MDGFVSNRREFCGLGLGALAAGFLKPVFAQTDCEIWYARDVDGEEALAMPIMRNFHPTHLEIRVGAKKPFRLLHISDSHLAQMNSRDLAKADEVELKWYESRRRHFENAATGLAAALLYAKAKRLPILHTGDLVDYLSDASCHTVRRDLEGVDCLFAVGNHELAGTHRPGPKKDQLAAARAKSEKYFPNPFMVSSRVINGVNFVAFDNVGMCDDVWKAQFAAIEKEFAKGLPVVLAYHTPFYSEALADVIMNAKGYKPERRDAINEAWLAACPGKPTLPINGKLSKWLREQKNLKALLCGHMHCENQVPFTDTVTQYVAGATFKGNAYEIEFV